MPALPRASRLVQSILASGCAATGGGPLSASLARQRRARERKMHALASQTGSRRTHRVLCRRARLAQCGCWTAVFTHCNWRCVTCSWRRCRLTQRRPSRRRAPTSSCSPWSSCCGECACMHGCKHAPHMRALSLWYHSMHGTRWHFVEPNTHGHISQSPGQAACMCIAALRSSISEVIAMHQGGVFRACLHAHARIHAYSNMRAHADRMLMRRSAVQNVAVMFSVAEHDKRKSSIRSLARIHAYLVSCTRVRMRTQTTAASLRHV